MQTTTELDNMAEFLSGLPGITVLPCDDPEKGRSGFVAFYRKFKSSGEVYIQKPDDDVLPDLLEEVAINPMVDICQPAVPVVVSLDQIKETIENCMGEGWIPCDDPKRRQLGFMKPFPLKLNCKSLCYMIDLTDLKAFAAKDLKERLNEWRAEWRQKTFREQVKEVLG